MPEFVSKVLHHLELYGTMKEGIYRVPGAKLEVDRLKKKLDADPHCASVDFSEFNVNAVAAAFKDFLRKLPVPLLPYDVSILSLYTPTMHFLHRFLKYYFFATHDPLC